MLNLHMHRSTYLQDRIILQLCRAPCDTIVRVTHGVYNIDMVGCILIGSVELAGDVDLLQDDKWQRNRPIICCHVAVQLDIDVFFLPKMWWSRGIESSTYPPLNSPHYSIIQDSYQCFLTPYCLIFYLKLIMFYFEKKARSEVGSQQDYHV